MQGYHVGFGQGFPYGNMGMNQVHIPGDLAGKWHLGIKNFYAGKVTDRSGPDQVGDAMSHLDQLLSQVPDVPAGPSIFRGGDLAFVYDQNM